MNTQNNPLHPSVLRLIAITLQAGAKLGKTVSVCGEMAGDTRLTKLLLGMGLRQFSMHPSNLLSVKQKILQSHSSKLSKASRKVLNNDEIEKIELLVSKMNH